MCDFFWLSPTDQGDLSDVVRASLHQLPAVATPDAATVYSHESLGAHDLPEEEELLPLQGANSCCGDDLDRYGVHLQQRLVHGDGMGVTVSSNSSSCDPLLLQPSPSCYPQQEGLVRHVMSGPPPQQLGAAGVVEGECVDAAAPEMDDHGLDMAMDHAHPHAPAIKRRKSQMKKVVCIPAPTAAPPGMGGRASTSGEVVPSDLWAWRKYGQKPIKGSPYPRGYYRCSSSKGCSARKQVERSRTDPSMLVITYTSDHNHPWPTQRNALAGSTRLVASSSATAKSHHRQHQSMAGATVPQPPRRHGTNNIVGDGGTTISISNDAHHQQQLPKQEVVDVMDHHRPEQQQAAVADHDLDMFADMDGALNILSASSFSSQKQQQHATAADDDDHLEQDDKQQQLDPFSFSFFDWVGASFGIGGANKDGYT